jgi:catechol 2,3-dioxygenase-like lactoylglutathione lyase family enzyme
MDRHALPRRLHHTAQVVKDQAVTRSFYEDVLGLPLVATWAEASDRMAGFEGERLEYCHTFYGLADGGALAFFQFADPRAYEKFKALQQTTFNHVALEATAETQKGIKDRLIAAGYKPRERDHGYCQSLYITDPDGFHLEFTSDPANVGKINQWQADSAHDTLTRWLAGDRSVNNDLRDH